MASGEVIDIVAGGERRSSAISKVVPKVLHRLFGAVAELPGTRVLVALLVCGIVALAASDAMADETSPASREGQFDTEEIQKSINELQADLSSIEAALRRLAQRQVEIRRALEHFRLTVSQMDVAASAAEKFERTSIAHAATCRRSKVEYEELHREKIPGWQNAELDYRRCQAVAGEFERKRVDMRGMIEIMKGDIDKIKKLVRRYEGQAESAAAEIEARQTLRDSTEAIINLRNNIMKTQGIANTPPGS